MPRIDSNKLKALLDQSLTYQGINCQVIEILSDEQALVLRDCQNQKVIQADQYGDAGYRVARTFTVALLDPTGQHLNPDLPELLRFNLIG